MSPLAGSSTAGRTRRGCRASAGLHVHWFHWTGEDPYSSASLYACRCGVVRPGL